MVASGPHARAYRRLLALKHVATELQSRLQPDELLRTLGEEIERLGVHC